MNIYQRLGLKRVINASGKMTILGVSSVPKEVMAATTEAASAFVEIDVLVDRVGELISQHTGAQDSYVTSCASAGVAIAVAAAITQGEPERVAQMPCSEGLANEIVMLRGHNIDYGASITTAIRLGGGKVVEVGQSNLAARWQLEKAITAQTAALFYVKSHHCVQKGIVAEGHAAIGVISAQFTNVEQGVAEVKRWMEHIPAISFGLGAGSAAQFYKAAMIAAATAPAHVNQTLHRLWFCRWGTGGAWHQQYLHQCFDLADRNAGEGDHLAARASLPW